MTQEQKDYINAKISEALSASLGDDWEEEFKQKFWWKYTTPSHQPQETNKFSASECEVLMDFIRAEKEKRESEIKSALETIDWSEIENGECKEHVIGNSGKCINCNK